MILLLHCKLFRQWQVGGRLTQPDRLSPERVWLRETWLVAMYVRALIDNTLRPYCIIYGVLAATEVREKVEERKSHLLRDEHRLVASFLLASSSAPTQKFLGGAWGRGYLSPTISLPGSLLP